MASHLGMAMAVPREAGQHQDDNPHQEMAFLVSGGTHRSDLKEEFQRHLGNAWGVSTGDESESRAREIALRVHELRVVEDVEKLATQLDPEPFTQPEVF
jgi:hypothetical protein